MTQENIDFRLALITDYFWQGSISINVVRDGGCTVR